MKNYTSISSAYLAANGLTLCYIKDACNQPQLYLLTDKQIKAYRARGISVSNTKS